MRQLIPLVFAAAACAPAKQQATAAGRAVIDCGLANADQVASVIDDMRTLSWPEIYARAKAAGMLVGGCALVRYVNGLVTPQASAVALVPSDAAETLEQFRAAEAGGAVWIVDGARL